MKFIFQGANLILFFLTSLHFQQLKAQSFKSLSEQAFIGTEDTTRVRALLKLYDKYYVVNTDYMLEGMNLILKAHHIALKIKDVPGIVESAYRIAGNLGYFKNDIKATEYYFIGLKYAESNGLFSKTSTAFVGLGLIFYNQKRWNEALQYFQKAIEVNDRFPANEKRSVPIYLSGLCNNEKREFSTALQFLNTALQIAIDQQDSNRIYECYLGIAKAKSNLGQTNEALNYYDRCKNYYSKAKAPLAYTAIHKEIAEIYLKRGELQVALREALEAYETDRHLTMPYYKVEITDLVSQVYAKLGDKNKAYAFLLENKQAMDSVMDRDVISKIALSEAQYNFEKKEAIFNEELETRKMQKNQALLLLSIFAGLIILGSYFYFVLRRERRKSENLLLNILPQTTVTELKKYGRAIAKRHDSVSIMFCDVKTFTKISENLSPERLVKMLDLYISEFDDIISRNGLEKIKTIGDAYMCACGLDIYSATHAEQAVKAAIEILKYVETCAEDIRAEFGNSFSLRIGIHTGPVVSGVVGSKKYAYDIWGDSVNIAARMEEESEPGKINISETTRLLVSHMYETTYRGKLRAKNMSEMDMYFINLLDLEVVAQEL